MFPSDLFGNTSVAVDAAAARSVGRVRVSCGGRSDAQQNNVRNARPFPQSHRAQRRLKIRIKRIYGNSFVFAKCIHTHTDERLLPEDDARGERIPLGPVWNVCECVCVRQPRFYYAPIVCSLFIHNLLAFEWPNESCRASGAAGEGAGSPT